VSYTTVIGACVKGKDPAMAYTWLQRMRSRDVSPNFHTYNTALASCLDGTLESSSRGSQIAAEMLEDMKTELLQGLKGPADYTSVMPDSYTKSLIRKLIKQLRKNADDGQIDAQVAKDTLEVPLSSLSNFEKSEEAQQMIEQRKAMELMKKKVEESGDDDGKEGEGEVAEKLEKTELAADFDAVNMIHKESHRTMEV